MDKQSGKLYLNMIIGTFEPLKMVQRSISSVKDFVDGAYITLTYKDTEEEGKELKTYLDSIGVITSYVKWTDDFSEARNFALQQVPSGPMNYIYWQDVDDVLQKGKNLRIVFEEALKNKWSCVGFDYWYQVDLTAEGKVKNVVIKHKRERLLRNDGTFRWKGMLHETPIEQKTQGVDKVYSEDCLVVHLTTGERSTANLDRNMRILTKQLEAESHSDPRTLIYLAKAYFDKGTMTKEIEEKKKAFNEALKLFDEYLNGRGKPGDKDYLEGSGWTEERASALGFISRIYEIQGAFDLALDAIDEAIKIAPQFPNYLVDKAAIYTNMGDMAKAKIWLTLATGIDMPHTTIVEAPSDMKVRALETDMHIALELDKDLPRARKDVEMLLELLPSERKMLEERFIHITSVEAANKAAQSLLYVVRYLDQIKETDKIPALLNAVPTGLRNERFYSEVRHKFIPPRVWGKREIAIVCGPGVQQWTPKTVSEGLGGSEEAVVYLSQELTKLGWQVTVYANPEDQAGDYEGVKYVPYYDFNMNDNFNALVLWRSIGLVDLNLNSKYTLLWMHDVPSNADFTEDRLAKINKIAVLSEFHKSLFRVNKGNDVFEVIPDNKFFVTRNGILDLGIKTWQGNSHKMVYVSSPDRGLVNLLLRWEDVRKEVPDAELHIYYGFDVYDVLFRDNPARMKWKRMVMDMMNKEGITYHGKVGHEELHKEMNSAGLWVYPTGFEEISCISAMKAQALGSVPVVTNFAALKETVANGIKVDVDIRTDEGKAEYIKVLIDMLKNPEKQEELRPNMMKWAQDYFLWSRVAKQWVEEIIPVIDTSLPVYAPALTPEEFLKSKKITVD